MNIALQPEWVRFIEEQLEVGRYETVEDVVSAALSRLRGEPEIAPEEVARLKAEVAIGVAEADRGEFVEFISEQIIREGRDILAGKKAELATRQKAI